MVYSQSRLAKGWILLGLACAHILTFARFAPAQQTQAWIEDVGSWCAPHALNQLQTLISPFSSDPIHPQSANYDSLEDWRRDRTRWVERWREWLGPMPPVQTPTAIQWLDSESIDGVVRRSLRIEVEPGVFMDAVFLRPDRSSIAPRSLPGIVALHPTTDHHLAEISGARGLGPRALGWHFAKLGYAVLCPKCFLWQDATDFSLAVERHRTRHPNTLGIAKMLFDAQRAVDALVSFDEVNPNRIAAIGHSLGAKEVLYLMAFDPRVKVGVASEGGIAFDSTNWDATWYLGPSVRVPHARPWHPSQLLALIAPRPLLILGGEKGPGAADGNLSLPAMTAAEPVWRLTSNPPPGKPLPLAIWIHGQGHVFDQIHLERSMAWIENWNPESRTSSER